MFEYADDIRQFGFERMNAPRKVTECSNENESNENESNVRI